MAVRFDDADPEVYGMLADVIREHFDDLDCLEPALTFDIRMAVNEKPGRPPVKKYGHACAATIEVVKPKERAAGGKDLRITIDYVRWCRKDDEERAALLFHETCHVKPKYNKKTKDLELDPYGRPEVKLRPHDWMLTGFKRTVEVYGDKAPERQLLDGVENLLGQRVLPFMKDGAATEAAQGDDAEKPRRRKAASS